MRAIVDLTPLDWRLLAAQKHLLLRMLDSKYLSDPERDTLAGMVSLCDAIQDSAEEAGHPVVFLGPENEKEVMLALEEDK